MLLQCRDQWKGKQTIRSEDLPWLLADWLPTGCLGVPANAQSGSQDMFLRLGGGVVGFALKNVSATGGTQWGDLRDELLKAPHALPAAGVPYTLVLWSVHLAKQVSQAVGAADAEIFAPGEWMFSNGKLHPVAANAAAATAFTVPLGMELIVVNPSAPAGGGLPELLGNRIVNNLREGKGTGGKLAIDLLMEWMPVTS